MEHSKYFQQAIDEMMADLPASFREKSRFGKGIEDEAALPRIEYLSTIFEPAFKGAGVIRVDITPGTSNQVILDCLVKVTYEEEVEEGKTIDRELSLPFVEIEKAKKHPRFEGQTIIKFGKKYSFKAILYYKEKRIDSKVITLERNAFGESPYASELPRLMAPYNVAYGIVVIYELKLITYKPNVPKEKILPKMDPTASQARREDLEKKRAFIYDLFEALDYIYNNGDYSSTVLTEEFKRMSYTPMVFDAKTIIDIITDEENAKLNYDEILDKYNHRLGHVFQETQTIEKVRVDKKRKGGTKPNNTKPLQVRRFVEMKNFENNNPGFIKPEESSKHPVINWDSRLASNFYGQNDEGKLVSGKQSPALVLFHELIHFFEYAFKSDNYDELDKSHFNNQPQTHQAKYRLWEEFMVVQYYENMLAKNIKGQEDQRVRHEGTDEEPIIFYKSKGPLSIEPLDANYKFLKL